MTVLAGAPDGVSEWEEYVYTISWAMSNVQNYCSFLRSKTVMMMVVEVVVVVVVVVVDVVGWVLCH